MCHAKDTPGSLIPAGQREPGEPFRRQECGAVGQQHIKRRPGAQIIRERVVTVNIAKDTESGIAMKSQRMFATCPSCHKRARFHFAGHQHWPPEIAAAHGLPAVIALWTCPFCQTTLSETALQPDHHPAATARRLCQIAPARKTPRFVAKPPLTRRCERSRFHDGTN
jgi:hypothetical protein